MENYFYLYFYNCAPLFHHSYQFFSFLFFSLKLAAEENDIFNTIPEYKSLQQLLFCRGVDARDIDTRVQRDSSTISRYFLCTGGAYYVPYSCLLISNKFCN